MISDDVRCAEYVREVLESGRGLSRRLLPRIAEFTGCFTLLPPNADVFDFWHGGKLPQPTNHANRESSVQRTPNQDSSLIRLISSFLAEHPVTGVCVFENFNARPEDPFIQRLSSRMRFVDGDVLHVIAPSDSDYQVGITLKEAKTVPIFVGVLATAGAIREEPLNVIEQSTQWIDELVAETRLILLGAYDGESYVVYTRSA